MWSQFDGSVTVLDADGPEGWLPWNFGDGNDRLRGQQ